jgi:hypothetical protein
MSTRIMSDCWALQMPPTAKAVLISLADNANDHGECWPSLATISVRTCFSERAVQNAIRWLEMASALVADRSNGRHTRYHLTPAAYAPPQEMHPAAGASIPPQQVRQPPQEIPEPPQQVPSNRKEPSRTVKATLRDCPDDVDVQVWGDWLALRAAKKAPVTETVVKRARQEAAKASMPLNRFLEIWCGRGSQGLEADWLKPNERSSYGQPQPSARMGKLTKLEEMKNGLGNSGNHHGDATPDLLGPRQGACLRLGGGNGNGVGGGG